MATNSPGAGNAIKRIMNEAKDWNDDPDPTGSMFAAPLEDNLFEWHFTFRGPPDSVFQDGVYHGRIVLPSTYPQKPPDIMLLTPNGRWNIREKICLSISGHHPDTWQPIWTVKTMICALRSFMETPAEGALGSVEMNGEDRQRLARESQSYVCDVCGARCADVLKKSSESKSTSSPCAGVKSDIAENSNDVDAKVAVPEVVRPAETSSASVSSSSSLTEDEQAKQQAIAREEALLAETIAKVMAAYGADVKTQPTAPVASSSTSNVRERRPAERPADRPANMPAERPAERPVQPIAAQPHGPRDPSSFFFLAFMLLISILMLCRLFYKPIAKTFGL